MAVFCFFFLQTIGEMFIEKALSIFVITQRDRKVKKTSTPQVSSATVWRYMTNNGWKALKRKRRCTLRADMVSEGSANFIPKDDRSANSRDVNPQETI